MDEDRVVVAEVLRPRGIRGEVVARPQSDVPGRLEQLRHLRGYLLDGSVIPLQVVSAWVYKDHWVFRFSGIESVEAANRLRGADLCVPRSERGELAVGEYFRSDLLGCSVTNAATGETIGTVQGWQQHGGSTPLMEVRTVDRQVLVPFAPDLCSVSLVDRTIQVTVPDGLLEL